MVVEQAERPKRKAGERGPAIPLLSRVQARNLYLNDCLPWRAISEKTGIPQDTLHRMANKEGWTAVRRAQKERLIQDSDARGNAMRAEVVDAIASASEQHAIRGLQRVGEALERSDEDAAKDFQSYTAGVKNLAMLARALRDPGASVPAGGVVNLNMFLLRPEAIKAREPKAVQPIEVKQVTD